MYWDKHGIEGINLRIGSTLPRPTEPRHLSHLARPRGPAAADDALHREPRTSATWSSWGVSNNTRSYWDNSGAERLGYQPVQNSEDYAAEILAKPNPLDPAARRYQGGGFVLHDFTPPGQRPNQAG